MHQSLHIVILAAGKGTRMYSALPKVLHRIGGKTMLERVIDTAQSLSPQSINVVIGHGKEQVREQVQREGIRWVEQTEQLGTGHAVQTALPHLGNTGRTLVLYGDVPLINRATLEELLQAAGNEIGLLTDIPPNPFGLGRIIREANGQVAAIVEEKDATPEQKAIRHFRFAQRTPCQLARQPLQQQCPRRILPHRRHRPCPRRRRSRASRSGSLLLPCCRRKQ